MKRLPMKACSTAPRVLLFAGAALLGACSGEVTAPSASTSTRPVEARSMFVPDAASMALIGVKDGKYTFTIDPRKNQVLTLGLNMLTLPANSVCNLTTSGYGPTTWNRSCTPHTLPVTITVVVKGALGNSPRMDFYPAMRFNPATNVQLFMYVPKVNKKDSKNWVMVYCPDSGRCIDESQADASLVTNMDRDANVLFRRIKHFSGYATADFHTTVDPLLP